MLNLPLRKSGWYWLCSAIDYTTFYPNPVAVGGLIKLLSPKQLEGCGALQRLIDLAQTCKYGHHYDTSGWDWLCLGLNHAELFSIVKKLTDELTMPAAFFILNQRGSLDLTKLSHIKPAFKTLQPANKAQLFGKVAQQLISEKDKLTSSTTTLIKREAFQCVFDDELLFNLLNSDQMQILWSWVTLEDSTAAMIETVAFSTYDLRTIKTALQYLIFYKIQLIQAMESPPIRKIRAGFKLLHCFLSLKNPIGLLLRQHQNLFSMFFSSTTTKATQWLINNTLKPFFIEYKERVRQENPDAVSKIETLLETDTSSDNAAIKLCKALCAISNSDSKKESSTGELIMSSSSSKH